MAAVEYVDVERPMTSGCETAACKGLTHLFFPSSAERPQARERREATARLVCATCTVLRGAASSPAQPRVRLLGR